ncbi:MAG: NUDIX domain-containing protein [Chitinophagaceae bacterium]|uniref:NUDIX hydrolase n=1 Tax=unclassified Paraflavitalea TaxID=2798305 RepID=UPI003D34D494|nr:NUDIX domain-containing protein [Chitinophagaceae bacterium]
MANYRNQSRFYVAVDCIVFGYDGTDLKLLLIKRGLAPKKGQWSLMGGFVQNNESADDAAQRILEELTGLSGIYLTQLHSYTDPGRDPQDRTISIAYKSLIDIQQYQAPLSQSYKAQWFKLNQVPKLIFDHEAMVEKARQELKYAAALHPILFELLPAKFTLPQLHNLFESVYQQELDKRNFSRKLLATGLLSKLDEKDKSSSRKGAYYYKVNKKLYKKHFYKILSLLPKLNEVL